MNDLTGLLASMPGWLQTLLLVALAVPMAISTSTYAVLQLTDRLFLAWYSEEGVAASLSGGVLVWVFMCLPFGVAGYVQTFIAQYLGAKRDREIGAILAQGMWIGGIAAAGAYDYYDPGYYPYAYPAYGYPAYGYGYPAYYGWGGGWGGGWYGHRGWRRW